MRKIALLLLLLKIILTSTTEIQKRIVNGNEATETQFPYIASIRRRATSNRHHCGGAIIDHHWILTAAHCIKYSRQIYDKLIVHVGSIVNTKLKPQGTEEVYNSSKVFLHPSYKLTNSIILNDIALLYIPEKIKFSEKVAPIPLGTVKDVDGVPLVVAGWGSKAYQSRTTHMLNFIPMHTVATAFCETLHARRGDKVDGNMQICADYPGKTVCQGDSGGPLVDVKTGRLVGVFSSMQYCEVQFPALFSRVSTFVDWIRNVTKLPLPLE